MKTGKVRAQLRHIYVAMIVISACSTALAENSALQILLDPHVSKDVFLSGLEAPGAPKDDKGEAVKVKLGILFNKIVSIDEIDETYTLDGYLEAEWLDPRNAVNSSNPQAKRMFVGIQVEQALTKIWWPYFEFINTVGSREVQNRRLTLEPDGKVIYRERFRASLRSDMDFREYPFDDQYFTAQIESFGYQATDLVFDYDTDKMCGYDLQPHPEWDDLAFMEPKITVSNDYSRITLGITADRNPEYFYYQFFLPLLLIIFSSWVVFWLRSFSEQITIGFTLMLTLVAFTFYTSTLLPRLPYNTFIELSVLSGYISIFATILVIVRHHWLEEKGSNFLQICRWLFPSVYFALATIAIIAILTQGEPNSVSGYKRMECPETQVDSKYALSLSMPSLMSGTSMPE